MYTVKNHKFANFSYTFSRIFRQILAKLEFISSFFEEKFESYFFVFPSMKQLIFNVNTLVYMHIMIIFLNIVSTFSKILKTLYQTSALIRTFFNL